MSRQTRDAIIAIGLWVLAAILAAVHCPGVV
jgi:hypothetical protein